ncbi:MAG: ATP-binding protein [Chloroflexi bacterium]|nr:ATP-binding protein [Chloroflexota bacterium]
MTLPPTHSIKTIQRRLILILVRAFLVVTAITIAVLVGTTLYEISSNTGRNPFYRSPSATVLEAYYLGHGSWEGIESLVRQGNTPDSRLINMEWERSILLDKNGFVVLYYGKRFPGVSVSLFSMPAKTNEMPLISNGNLIGTLLTDNKDLPHPVRLAFGVINPILGVALLSGLLTLIIGVLLMRRIVNPLAEVIAAAESVAAGNLKTRIKIIKSQGDLASLVEHFNHMTETLERNDNERRALLADVAHELRTPLSVLRGRLEGIMDGVYTPNEINIAQALEETYLLERLVEDLRLLTLAESRQLHFELKETNLVDLLEKTVGVFTPQAASKKVTLSLQSQEAVINVLVDGQRMEQVIGNLIGNSLRYVPGNGQVNLAIRRDGTSVRIQVIDNGPGVSADELPFLFERFWRGEKSRARVTGGAGLGLAITKQLVEAQGGQILATNSPEGGLIITITFPQVTPPNTHEKTN